MKGIQKITSTKKLQNLLNSTDNDLSESKKFVRFSPALKRLDDDSPMPDQWVDSQYLNTPFGGFYVVTDRSTPELTSWLIPEAYASEVRESEIPMNESTDPFGSIDINSPALARSVEHSQISAILKQEETMRGGVALTKILIRDDINFGGWTQIAPNSEGDWVDAKRVLNNNIPMYIISNEMDNYSRPDIISESHLKADPIIMSIITPEADRKQAKALASEKAKNTAMQMEQERKVRAKKEQQARLDMLKPIEKVLGESMTIEKYKSLGMSNMIRLANMLNDYKEITGKDMLIGVMKDLPAIEVGQKMFESAHRQLFQAKYGFYLENTLTKEKAVISLVSEGAVLAQAALTFKGGNLLEYVDVHNHFDDDSNPYRVKVPVIRIDSATNNTKVFEFGQELWDEGKFEQLWLAISDEGFADNDYISDQYEGNFSTVSDINGNELGNWDDFKTPYAILDRIKDDSEEVLINTSEAIEEFKKSMSNDTEYGLSM